MKMLLNGQWVDRKNCIEILNPQNGELVGTVPIANLEDVEVALESAVSASEVARTMPAHQRISILRKAADMVEVQKEDFARTIALEGIKTIREARKEVARCVETLRISSEEARRISGETIPFDQSMGSEDKIGYYVREPAGIIVAITPFNDPLNLVAHKVGPAIASGNAVILKPHSATPLSALMLAEVLVNAGLPKGVLQVLTGNGREIGPKLVSDPRVRMVSFTGGLSTGEKIIKMAGLKKVSMELGSNCPTIVMDDADLEYAVASSVSGAFWAAGQNCLHVQRIFVQSGIYEGFKESFIKLVKDYKVGDKLDESTDMGCLINEYEAKRVERTVNDALQSGANLLTGGEREGSFYTPTVIENVPKHSTLCQDEIYGPVTILEQFDNLDQAIERANSVNYGLQGAIFTHNMNAAFKAISKLKVGGVMVNESTDYRIDSMPFGGTKGSGLGREGVRFSIMEMTEPKVVCIKL
jgi:glyceraldehyde-3-phosphate dehydrogenase (NADP+)